MIQDHLSLPGLNPLKDVAEFKITDKTPQILKVCQAQILKTI